MNEKQFLEKMMDILETNMEVTMETNLEDIEEWDSLAFVSFLSMAKVSCHKTLETSQIRTAISIYDLFKLLN